MESSEAGYTSVDVRLLVMLSNAAESRLKQSDVTRRLLMAKVQREQKEEAIAKLQEQGLITVNNRTSLPGQGRGRTPTWIQITELGSEMVGKFETGEVSYT